MKKKFLAYALGLILLLLLLWYALRSIEATGTTRTEQDLIDGLDGDVRRNLTLKIDTRLATRWDYHRAVYSSLRAAGMPELTARMMTAHASKAQRGWKTPNPGKLWNFNCFGIKANPEWQRTKPYYVADTMEFNATTGYYPTTSAWRSYGSIRESVDDYLSLLHASKYRPALTYARQVTHLLHSNFLQWARLLKQGGYFTADADHWGDSVFNIYYNIVRPDLTHMDDGGAA